MPSCSQPLPLQGIPSPPSQVPQFSLLPCSRLRRFTGLASRRPQALTLQFPPLPVTSTGCVSRGRKQESNPPPNRTHLPQPHHAPHAHTRPRGCEESRIRGVGGLERLEPRYGEKLLCGCASIWSAVWRGSDEDGASLASQAGSSVRHASLCLPLS